MIKSLTAVINVYGVHRNDQKNINGNYQSMKPGPDIFPLQKHFPEKVNHNINQDRANHQHVKQQFLI